MDRREFLEKSVLAAGGILLSSTGIESLAKENTKKMNIVVITGSPRRNGNTNHMADQFIKGAKEAGHEVFRFDAATRDVKPCLGCNHCDMDGPCVYKDDFSTILRPQLEKADMVVFCSPMYYFGFSAQIKHVIDRFYAINSAIHGRKKTAFLMAYANTAASDAEPMIAHYKRIASYMGWEDAGMVIAPGIWPVGAVNGTKYATQAYELGKSLA